MSWLIAHDDVYELKRWPRERRPEPLNLPLAGPPLPSDHEANPGRRVYALGGLALAAVVSVAAFAATDRQLSETPRTHLDRSVETR